MVTGRGRVPTKGRWAIHRNKAVRRVQLRQCVGCCLEDMLAGSKAGQGSPVGRVVAVAFLTTSGTDSLGSKLFRAVSGPRKVGWSHMLWGAMNHIFTKPSNVPDAVLGGGELEPASEWESEGRGF